MGEYWHNFKVVAKGRDPSPLNSVECAFILGIRFAEYGLSLRVIHKTAYIHQCRFPILKHMPVAAAYARQQVFNFIYRLYTNVPEMAKLKAGSIV